MSEPRSSNLRLMALTHAERYHATEGGKVLCKAPVECDEFWNARHPGAVRPDHDSAEEYSDHLRRAEGSGGAA